MATTGWKLPKIKPMLAVPAEPFNDGNYLYEIKWDGYRGLAYLGAETRLLSRNQLELTHRFPELEALHRHVRQKPALLDGEIVVLQAGKPSFSALQARGRLDDPLKIARLAAQTPAVYLAFDVLYQSGLKVMDRPLKERKQLLTELVEEGPDLLVSQYVIGSGTDFFAAVQGAGLEGMMAKGLDSTYLAGKRSGSWKKVRCSKSAELVIGGWEKGAGQRSLGALILVGRQGNRWQYSGKVGTGFSRDEEQRLLAAMTNLVVAEPAFHPPKGEFRFPIWVQPAMVCEVTYTEVSPEGRLRHPCYKGIRQDKAPAECLCLSS